MSEVVIVTGCSQGVGLGIATVYARNGAKVLGCDRSPPAEAFASAANYHHVQGDLTEAGALERVVAACLEKYGRIDTLVNNAGVGGARGFMETTPADYKRYYDINVAVTLELSKLAIPHLKTTKGSIVNIASAFGLIGAAQSSAYVPTKYAIVGITRMLATELGGQGIRVNAVAPGLIYSPGTAKRIETSPWWHKQMIESCPMGRFGQAEEIGDACAFLSSPRASFINGVVLPVDGGWTIAKFLPNPEP